MEQKIVETANKYKELAMMLEDFAIDQPLDGGTPEEVQAALLKLYYAKAFEAEIEKCEDLLGEDTDDETVNAVAEAAEKIDAASESAFYDIEAYSRQDRAFEKTIEGISESSVTDGIRGLLYKLYKCEGIIRMAERCSKRFPLYGIRGMYRIQQDDEVMDLQQSIEQRVGIDICGLLEVRQRLVEEIGAVIGKDGRFQ
jgi:hypothetical protein